MAWKIEGDKVVEYDANGKATGKSYNAGASTLIISQNDGYRSNNLLRRGTMKDVQEGFRIFLETGEMPTAAQLKVSEGALDNIKRDIEVMAYENGIDFPNYNISEEVSEQDAKEAALNNYYKDIYNPEQAGTMGNKILGNMESAAQREANIGAELANIQFQDAAMNQAAIVKQITDQVRSERMARLKAGMSESQIANQDMQTMMANVNALNQNQQMLGQNRLMAQAGQLTAKDQAYDAYLQQANAMGQNAAAFSASDAGNADYIAKQILIANPNMTYNEAMQQAQTGEYKKK
jgi:hypothetical protein